MSDIELVSAGISPLQFYQYFLHRNVPCLIDESLTASWRARSLWQTNGTPNYEYLKKKFGNATVPVADCNDLCFSSHPKTLWNFNEFINYWEEFNKTITATTTTRCESSTTDDQLSKSVVKSEKRLLYLKDWHFTRDYPSYDAYTVPDVFSSDWLNEVWDHQNCEGERERDGEGEGEGGKEKSPQAVKDDYRFVYMGPNGTWTPFHADVLRSYSWSVNICGRKEWLIYPPGQEEFLKDRYGNLPIDITELQQDSHMYPNVCKAGPPLRVVQETGQAIFIPSGWYHQVRNIGDTISINHNWINVFGIEYTWKYLISELKLVEKEIDDCKSMEGWKEQCQLILKTETGMNFDDFYKFLHIIARSRLKKLKELKVDDTPSRSNSVLSGSDSDHCSGTQFLFTLLSDDIKQMLQQHTTSSNTRGDEVYSATAKATPFISGTSTVLLYMLYELYTVDRIVKLNDYMLSLCMMTEEKWPFGVLASIL